MNDRSWPPPDRAAVDAQTLALRAMSVEQKLVVAESLRNFAWELKRSVFARENPRLSAAEVEERVRQLFRRAGA